MSVEYQAYTPPSTKRRTFAAFALGIFLFSVAALTMPGCRSAPSSSVGEARKSFSEYRLADGLKHLQAALEVDPDDPDALYLKGEALVLNGRPEVWDIIHRLKAAGRLRDAGILSLKVDLFLGDEDLAERTSFLAAKHPGHPEIELVEWLRRNVSSLSLQRQTFRLVYCGD